MNRYLMAGCAAVALGLGSGAAQAQAKFEVRIGGDAYFEGGYIDQDNDTGLRDTEFRNRFRLNIVPSAKADNGLEYGGRIRIRANNADRSMDADRALIFVAGSFGRVELGTRNSFNDDSYIARPIDYQFLGIYDSAVSWASANNAAAGTGKLSTPSFGNLPGNSVGSVASSGAVTAASTVTAGANDDIESKIVYISPRFAGFQLGASYAPRVGGTDSGATVFRTEDDGTLQDVYEIGANYRGEFSGVTVAASAGYIGGSYEDSTTAGVSSRYEDLSGFQAGAQIGYAGFVLGGGYVWYGESGAIKTAGFKDDYEVWNIGLQYTTGPIQLGVGYTHGSDAGRTDRPGERSQDYLSVGASYTVAPGLRVQAEYAYINYEVNDLGTASANQDVESNVFILRSVLSF